MSPQASGLRCARACLGRKGWATLAARRSARMLLEMDESLVGSPGFKPVREALILSWVGSIPTHLRQPARPPAACQPPA